MSLNMRARGVMAESLSGALMMTCIRHDKRAHYKTSDTAFNAQHTLTHTHQHCIYRFYAVR